ncbi:hypothetical protein LB518_11690 [Mesorhizobium sp. BR1-1-16]|uniref:hypothetical protein n=1 Tax=Mesorhizobium sp. BR1-1-16 TaxID=2876653 RepID=UPI001CCCDD1D|nr:hypothetical protein [Mesorhizobium sp. BR1-1-16]MBZ9936959.1 hypothetical protein [Mesorhizobium sp. BR1-1-16]
MIVYGDAERSEWSGTVRDDVVAGLCSLGGGEFGRTEHDAVVETFIRSGELLQGLADAELAQRGFDADSPLQERAAKLLLLLARLVDQSARGAPDMTQLAAAKALASSIPPDILLKTRRCEGYAHYALMPEAYLAAARASGLPPDTLVIGLRSIGTSLGALVAAALGAAPAITLRPGGAPFERRIRADPALLAGAAATGRPVAVVDEGPGLSGSSLAAAAQWLLDNGVRRQRIIFFCGHNGEPGSAASERTRALWAGIVRHSAAEHDVIRHSEGLERWIRPLVGIQLGPPLAFYSGSTPSRKQARDIRFERLKFIVKSETGTYLVRFAGLGALGRQKHADAVALEKAGFGPETIGLCRGFLVQRWVTGEPPDRMQPDFVTQLGNYLAFRARHFPDRQIGASPDVLREMSIHNVGVALGRDAAYAVAMRLLDLTEPGMEPRPVRVDGRLHAWEWLRHRDRIVKLDAVDHWAGHDLVGCQDIAWDIAGASVELGLGPAERARIMLAVARGGAAPRAALVDSLRICYCAFQLGLWTTAVAVDLWGQTINRRRAGLYAALLTGCSSSSVRRPGGKELTFRRRID